MYAIRFDWASLDPCLCYAPFLLHIHTLLLKHLHICLFENSIAWFELHICLVYIALFFVVSIGYVSSLLPFINSILCILRFSIIGMLFSIAAAVEG